MQKSLAGGEQCENLLEPVPDESEGQKNWVRDVHRSGCFSGTPNASDPLIVKTASAGLPELHNRQSDPHSWVTQVKQEIFAVNVVDIAIVVVGPICRPGIREYK
jgi:hypothetical protein